MPTKRLPLAAVMLLLCQFLHAQFLMDMVDTTKETGKGLLAVYKKFDHLRIGGYIQPQFQVASAKGVKNFEGGDFSAQVNNRFMLRRSRVRIDYIHFGKDTKPGVQIVFQFDANERGFTVRDVWGRIVENKFKLFSFTTGIFARPFGYEINLSSSDRESPERGRMSQLHAKSERDLGAMLSFEVRQKSSPLKNIRIDLAVFNGQGINATSEFDNTKDLVGRIILKPVPISKTIQLSAGASFLHGGLQNNTKYIYTTETTGAIKRTVVDSAASNVGTTSPRHYYGADMQLKFNNGHNRFTELRAEFITGIQTGTANNPETPTALLTGTDGFHQRHFTGAYFYLLQHFFSPQHQLLIKYDWYDPNSKVKGKGIGAAGSNFTAANIKYNTLGFGYLYYVTENIKLVLYYARVRNEKTFLPGYTNDVKDNVFTCRLQYRF